MAKKWTVKQQTEWANEAHAMIESLGADEFGNIETIAGEMHIHPVLSQIEPWIHCRFDDVTKAKELIHHGQLNPFSGKWNWMTADLFYVKQQIVKILKLYKIEEITNGKH